jgi:hypothetical protein
MCHLELYFLFLSTSSSCSGKLEILSLMLGLLRADELSLSGEFEVACGR